MPIDHRALLAAAGAGVALLAALGFWIVSDDVGDAMQRLTSERLSDRWKVSDLTVSATAKRLGIDNTPTPEALANLSFLVVEALDPIVDFYGNDVTVTSGYRNDAVNRAVGGSSTSDHRHGLAVDFVTHGGKAETEALFHRIREELLDVLPIDQLIFYPSLGHIHLGVRRGTPRRMAGFNVKGGPNQWLT